MKQQLLDVAEVTDALRIFPRLVLCGFGWLLSYILITTCQWYFHLPSAERTAQVTAVIGILIPAVSGLAVWVYKIYSVGGRDWTARKDTP